MMTIRTLSSASSATEYYAGYYNQKEYSEWHGNGAKQLGLQGEVKKESFHEVLAGELPDGSKLGRHGKDGWEHRPGYDLTVSAPKSYSIMMLADKELINLFIKAAKQTVDYIQAEYTFARCKVKGKEEAIQTNNLIAAMFTQFFSRDLDMQLHNHIILMNATHDGEKFRALSRDAFGDDLKYLGLIFRNYLAEMVQKRGYEIVETSKDGFWEFKDIPRSVIEQFSKRRLSIEKYAKQLSDAGINVDMQLANLSTRPNKDESAGYDAIIDMLKQELNDKTCMTMDDLEQIKKNALARGSIDFNDEKAKITKAVDRAISHLTSFEDSFTRNKLVKQARAYGVGSDIGLIKAEINSRIGKEHLYSDKSGNIMTFKTHEQIKTNIQLMQKGQGQSLLYRLVAKIGSRWVLDNPTEYKQEQLISLLTTRSQYVALNVNDQDGYDIIRGMSKLTAGYRVTAIIPFNIAGENYSKRQQNLGINGVYTLSGIKKYWQEQFANSPYINKGSQVFVVDKAHLFNTQSINEIMLLADKLGAKVIFNVKGSLGKLNNQLGGCNALLDKGMEQIGDRHIQNLEEKINTLTLANRIQMVTGFDKQMDLIKELCQNSRRVPRVVVPTTSLKTALNEDIRNSLVVAGRIAKDSIKVNILDKTSMSDMDRRHIQFYQIGYIVRGDGEYYKVKDINRKNNTLQLVNLKTNEPKEWDFSKKAFQTIDVYQQRELAIARGDSLTWTKTITIDGKKRLRNCLIQVVDTSDKNNIKVKDNLGKEYIIHTKKLQEQHFNRAYVKTIQESIYKDSRIDVLYCPRGKLDSVKAYTCLDMLSKNGKVIVSDLGSLGGTQKSIEFEKGSDISERDARVIVADNSVTHAILKLSERDAVFSLKNLKKAAMEYCGNRVSLEDINDAIDRAFAGKELIDTKATADKLVHDDTVLLTTKNTLSQEQACVKLMQDSKGKLQAILEPDNPMLQSIRNHPVLNQSQKDAVEFILTNKDGLAAVQGIAGTGKTTIMREVVRVCSEIDLNVVGVVVTTSGRDELKKSLSGVVSKADIETFTVRKLLNEAKHMQNIKDFPRTLFILDESSLVSTKEMLALQQLGYETGQKLLTVGDFQQNKSIGAGHPYKLMLKNGISHKTLDVNVRLQAKRTLEATKAIYQGDVASAINNIKTIQIKDKQLAIDSMANEYISSIKHSPGSGRAGISLTNRDRVEINNAIRFKLKNSGMLGDEGLATQILVSKKELYDTDKQKAVSYEVGDIIKFSDGYKNDIARGAYCRVVRYDSITKTVTLRDSSNQEIDWTPDLQSNLDKIEVFVAAKRNDLRQYDSIIWRTNNEKRGIVNGEAATVLSIDVEKQTFTVELGNGKELTLDATACKNQHWDYSYTITTYLIQGRTIQDNLFYVDTKSIRAASLESLLVTITRGNNVQLITDDVKELVEIFKKDGRLPETALELMQDGWGKEFQDKFRANVKGDAEKLPSKVFVGEFDYLKKTAKVAEYLEANKLAGREYYQHKQRVDTIGHEIANILKDESISSIQKRNALAHNICQNLPEYTSILAGHNIDVDKLLLQSQKHIEVQDKTEIKLDINQLQASIVDYKNNREKLLEKELNKSTNLLDWSTAFNDNIQVGAKFAARSLELDVLTGKDQEILNKVHEFIDSMKKSEEVKSQQDKKARVQYLSRSSKPIANTRAEEYANSRGIDVKSLSKDIRHLPKIYEPETKKYMQALVSIARDKHGVEQSIEVMYLTKDDNGKTIRANIDINKRSYGRKSASSVCVQQGKGNTIYLAEGLFTAMSAANVNKDLRVYASLSSGNLPNFEVPKALKDKIKQIIILADNDGKGAASSKDVTKASKLFALKGLNVSVATPKMLEGCQKTDLNDVLIKQGINAIKQVLQNPLQVTKAITKESLVEDIKDIYVESIIDGEIAKGKQQRIGYETKMVKNKDWRMHQAKEVYKQSHKISNTKGEQYLSNFCNKSNIPNHIRFVASINHPKLGKETFSAIVAPVQNAKGQFQGSIQIYLDEQGRKLNKATLKNNEKIERHICLANKKGNFVMLNNGQDDKLYITNTVEDGLSILPHTKESTVLMALSWENYKTIQPQPGTREIIMCVDKDVDLKNSHLAKTKTYFQSKGLNVSIRTPDMTGSKALSFQDLQKNHGADAVSKVLHKSINTERNNVVMSQAKDNAMEKSSTTPKQELPTHQAQITR